MAWELCAPPDFDNNIGTLRFDGAGLDITIEIATRDGDREGLRTAVSLPALATITR